ncbi:Murein L,D-transpeptidase YafK [Bartonella apis]|uniref:L,D-transpeptidase family protein n=1 Tax=Bartonella apis TaxID=1686310 RepID=UPI0009627C34|nr:murein L,D-transpeptidase family protein [Bartonella apis]OLY46721.1 Murein L,D-transpeptidase YafK [Bartonella apis]
MKFGTALLASFFLTATFLSGCQQSSNLPQIGKATQELPKKLQDKMAAKNMEKYSPILVRVFKEESVVEIWKQTRTGKYDLISTYNICKWSGKLGPKYMEGDRQAPEGFYTIRPSQMNPNSNYYLAFNIGFPNAYDQVNGRTGQHLMVHGACSSSGCYSMSDENIAQIYAFGRDSFKGGQREFQLEAFPFRMTAENMARYRNDPNYKFWTMLKEGYDIFEVTKRPPKVDVCEKRYVFNRNTDSKALTPAGVCPAAIPDSSLETAFASYQKKYDDAFSSAREKKMKAPAPTIQGVEEASLVADWSRKRASGVQVSREPPSLTPASKETPNAPDIAPANAVASKATNPTGKSASTVVPTPKPETGGQSLAEEEAQNSGAPVTPAASETPTKKPFWKLFGG